MKRRKIKNGWREYFNFSSRERQGTMLLSIIILAQIAVLYGLRNYDRSVPPQDPQLIKAVLALAENKNVKVADTIPVTIAKPTPFDPNKLNRELALSVGLTDKQSKTILNYLSKGGVFRTKNDFRKMYCLNEKQFDRLEPYLLLPDSISRPKKELFSRKKIIVNINKADSAQLTQIRGIGPVFASRIVKYREKLGGFISPEQLLEVWGMRDSLFDVIKPFVELTETVPGRYIHLNTDSSAVLASHPYIRWKLASLIVSYRAQHPFHSAADLRSIPLVTDEIFRKLAPYLQPD